MPQRRRMLEAGVGGEKAEGFGIGGFIEGRPGMGTTFEM